MLLAQANLSLKILPLYGYKPGYRGTVVPRKVRTAQGSTPVNSRMFVKIKQ